jgi:hypothetical protein
MLLSCAKGEKKGANKKRKKGRKMGCLDLMCRYFLLVMAGKRYVGALVGCVVLS